MLVAALALVKVAALKHNGCKDQFFGRGVGAVLKRAVEFFPNDPEVVREAALAFRSIVRGDGTIDSKAPACVGGWEGGWVNGRRTGGRTDGQAE